MLDWQKNAQPGQGYIQFCPGIDLVIYGVLMEDPDAINDEEIVWVTAGSVAMHGMGPEGGTTYRTDLHVPISKETVEVVQKHGYDPLHEEAARRIYPELNEALDKRLVPDNAIVYAAQLLQLIVTAHPMLVCMTCAGEGT